VDDFGTSSYVVNYTMLGVLKAAGFSAILIDYAKGMSS
jgi:hypothetical protein